MAERPYPADLPQQKVSPMRRVQYLGYAAVALAALACSDGSEKGASSTVSASRYDVDATATINTVPPRVDLTPTANIPRPVATPIPRQVLPTPPRDGALSVDGRQDGMMMGRDGINLNKSFKITADVTPLDEGFSAGGDTIIGWDEQAVFLRSPYPDCFGKIGALLDGVYYCTNGEVMRGDRSTIKFEYNGQNVLFELNGKNIGVKNKPGPLTLSNRDIYVGTRSPVAGLNRQPLNGLIYKLTIEDEGKVVAENNFENAQDLINTGPGIRRTQILGQAKIVQ